MHGKMMCQDNLGQVFSYCGSFFCAILKACSNIETVAYFGSDIFICLDKYVLV